MTSTGIVHKHTNIATGGYTGTPEMREEVWRLVKTPANGEPLSKDQIAKRIQGFVPKGDRRVITADDVNAMLREKRLELARAE